MGRTRTGIHQVESDHLEKKPKMEPKEEDLADEEVPTYHEIWNGPGGSALADKVVKEEQEVANDQEEERVPVCVASAAKVEPDEDEIPLPVEVPVYPMKEEVEEEEEEPTLVEEDSCVKIPDDGDSLPPVPSGTGKRKKVGRDTKVGRHQVEPRHSMHNNVVAKEEEEIITAEEELIKEEEQVPVRDNAAKVEPDEEEVPMNLRNEEVQEEEQVPVRVVAAKVEPDQEEIPVNLTKEEVKEEEPILVEEDSCIEISDDDYSPSPLPKSRKAQASTVKSGKRKKVGRPRKLNTESHPRQEDYPSFKLRVEPRHLTHNNVLVPYHMVRLNLPRTLREVTLRVGSGEWKVRFIRFTSNKTGRMSVGWLEFAEANSLEVDDVCVFKMVQTGVFQVSINDGDE